MVAKRPVNSLELRWSSVKHYSEVVWLLCLLSAVNKYGVHHTKDFLMRETSCKLWATPSGENHTLVPISHTYSLPWPNTKSCTISTSFSALAVFGAPMRGSWKSDVTPCWSAFKQFLPGSSKVGESFYCIEKLSDFVAQFRLQKKIGAPPDISFSTFQNCAGTPAFTPNETDTTSQIHWTFDIGQSEQRSTQFSKFLAIVVPFGGKARYLSDWPRIYFFIWSRHVYNRAMSQAQSYAIVLLITDCHISRSFVLCSVSEQKGINSKLN